MRLPCICDFTDELRPQGKKKLRGYSAGGEARVRNQTQDCELLEPWTTVPCLGGHPCHCPARSRCQEQSVSTQRGCWQSGRSTLEKDEDSYDPENIGTGTRAVRAGGKEESRPWQGCWATT